MKFAVLFLAIIISADLLGQEKPLAFPGADGFGKYTTGGRGGTVYVVSNLNDDGPGSLRNAIDKKEARTILFAISGTIELKSPINIDHGNVTLAGQSAPGGGICIRNYPFLVTADNVIIRFLRFRLGDITQQESDAFGGTKGKSNIIIDHCSISWATDECASFYRNRNFTMQWCIISESLNRSVHAKGEHGYGGIWGGEGATFHHNLLASHTSRLPRFSGSSTTPNSPDELVDFRNNVIYNWAGNNTYGGERGRYNIVNNYYKAGPALKSKKVWMVNPWSPYGQFFINGNCLDGDAGTSKNNHAGVKADNMDSVLVSRPFPVQSITEHSAEQAFDLVLQFAGASLKRDVVDVRIADETRTGKSSSGKGANGIIDSQKDVGGWPELKSLPAPKDTDSDGMPDDWETKYNLSPSDASDSNKYSLDKAYTNLEVYINGLVSHIVDKSIKR
jgi:hypothetical protein